MIDAAKIEELRGLLAADTSTDWQTIRADPAENADVWWICAKNAALQGGFPHPKREARARLIVAMRNALPELLDLASEKEGLRRERDDKHLFERPCEQQLELATALAANVGYIVIEDPISANGEEYERAPGQHYQAGYDAGQRDVNSQLVEQIALLRESQVHKDLQAVMKQHNETLARAKSAEAEVERLRAALKDVLEIAARNESGPVIDRARSELEAGHE